MDVLVFEVGGIRYALPAAEVREIVRAVTIVPLPTAPAMVEGLINVRGEVVPVLDVRSPFRLPAKPLTHTDHLVLAWAGPRLVAVRADRALDLIRVQPGSIDDARMGGPGADCVAGVATVSDGLVLIHDLRAFLDDAEAAALDNAMATDASPGSPA